MQAGKDIPHEVAPDQPMPPHWPQTADCAAASCASGRRATKPSADLKENMAVRREDPSLKA